MKFIIKQHNTTEYKNIKNGSWLLYNGEVYIKDGKYATNLSNGQRFFFSDSDNVNIIVDQTITLLVV